MKSRFVYPVLSSFWSLANETGGATNSDCYFHVIGGQTGKILISVTEILKLISVPTSMAYLIGDVTSDVIPKETSFEQTLAAQRSHRQATYRKRN